jgi:hypothetical protein
MDEHKKRHLIGHPSDYGSRTLADEERERDELADVGSTADGEPRVDRGTAESAISRDRATENESKP